MVNEKEYQAGLIQRLKKIFPGCIVMKNDSSYIQGIPDLTILYKNKWAMLEVKRSAKDSHRPNQDYYVEKTDGMSFGAFIFPENESDTLRRLEGFFNEI